MEITTNMFLIIASLILFLYVIFVFVLFLPMIGFGITPVIVIAIFAAFSIIISIFYNNYDPEAVTKDYDSIYVMSLTVASIVVFVILVFVIWFIYTSYSTGKENAIEDISQEKDGVQTPFSSSKTY